MKNWKTTLLGCLAGALMMFGQIAQARATNPSAPPITAANVLPAVGLAALGALSKDHDK